MYLKNLQLVHFKNHREASFDFTDKVNAIVGENGSGKTNLLDAIHYLSFCKSYFSAQDFFSILFGKEFFALHGEFETYDTEQTRKISCIYKQGSRKVMKVNAKEYDRLSDHIGQYPLIMVSPYDNELIQNGSEVRRKFFDMIISQFDKNYLHQVISYQKIINQRNTILKQFFENRYVDNSLIEIYNEQLVPLGEAIHQKRKQFVVEILPLFQKYYDFLAESKEQVTIVYQSQLTDTSFADALRQQLTTDARTGYTTTGIHKDDFLFLMNDHLVKRFSSQGQQKSYALSLKLAQFDYMVEQKRVKPILLLDDIFDKLDEKRIAKLLHLVGDNHFGQVFLTDTEPMRVTSILETYHIKYKLFEMKNYQNEENNIL